MRDSINLCIADIHLVISCQDTVLQDIEPYYHSFYSNVCEDPEKINVRIYPELPDTWDIEKLKKIFDSEQSWSIFQNGTDYFLTISSIGTKIYPICVARFNKTVKEIQIYCNDAVEEIAGKKGITNPFCYPLDRLLMMYILAKKKGVVIHSACIEINEMAYIFAGSSGAGKTTISRQFALRKGGAVLSDERVVIRKADGKYKAFGTPWPGEAGIAVNKGLPLSGIFFIYHGIENKIKEIKCGDALQRLLPITFIPWYDPEIMTEILFFYEELLSDIPTYELFFKPDDELVDFLGEFTAG